MQSAISRSKSHEKLGTYRIYIFKLVIWGLTRLLAFKGAARFLVFRGADRLLFYYTFFGRVGGGGGGGGGGGEVWLRDCLLWREQPEC